MIFCKYLLPWLLTALFFLLGWDARRDRKELEKIGDAIERMIEDQSSKKAGA